MSAEFASKKFEINKEMHLQSNMFTENPKNRNSPLSNGISVATYY